MLKQFVAAGLLLIAGATANAQTLFIYGTDSVSVPQFLKAYNKNNTAGNSAASKKQYLDLYIASRLKIKEAEERGYHLQPHLQAELASLREQIALAYLADDEAVDQLANEALQRAQKDIELSHIFIAFIQDGLLNEEAAKRKTEEALLQLQNGKAFADVARQFSDDPSAKANDGKIGFITVFTLPYQLENVAYNTAAGSFSKPHLSKSGYHIFKVDSERKAWGRLRLSQILLAFPPGADAATNALLKKRADSIYNRLLKGDDFGRLATQLSDDAVSAQAAGQLPETGIGQYDALFENTVFALPKDGAISPPFKTSHGYHIVKRLAKIPVSTSQQSYQAMRARVEASTDRMAIAQAALTQRILESAPIKKHAFTEADLWAYSDSVLDGKREKKGFAITGETPLFTLGETTATVTGFIQFAQTARFKNDGSGIKPYGQVWDAFVQSAAMEHYKNHLETYNATFRQQLEEFKEGSLFFEIMQREIWNKAQADTAALHHFYNANKAKYKWQKSADAILFFAPDAATTKSLQAAVSKAPHDWRLLIEQNNNSALADSGRFELERLPGRVKGILKAGSITQPVQNKTDNSYAFAYIVKMYPQPAQRSFTEARSLVMADYQAQLEKAWVESLREKYGVQIRETVWQQLLNTQ